MQRPVVGRRLSLILTAFTADDISLSTFIVTVSSKWTKFLSLSSKKWFTYISALIVTKATLFLASTDR
ncbi:hypothetical protein L596_021406 [Steinernema carpocapsae]|uniref:Uncharacterized protein n=1 Tax=Steinernema carpocapsae TaxID=34508 RepID=A0A4U5MJ15_STECR|nr:hypothetical protein L596_021406 [Steinernema carpocapsae]